MNMTDDEKLEYLLKAGGKRCYGEKTDRILLFDNILDAAAFRKLPQEKQNRILAILAEGSDPDPAVSGYGKEDLVKITMPDEGMYPNLWTGDELTIAFREEVREGDLAAVSISGLSMPVTVREVSYDRDNVWLIPGNEVFPIDCCAPEKVMILGKVVCSSRR